MFDWPIYSQLDVMTIRTRGDTTAGDSSDNTTLVIVLSTVLSVLFVGAVVFTVYLCSRRSRRRFGGLFRRGITPIGDDEIATWRLNRPDEKESDRYTTRSKHTPNASTSTRKAPSVIQYQNGGRASEEVMSPSVASIKKSMSFELPRMPESAVLAVAPNARTGLTDDTVPGDEPYLPVLPSPRRNTSRLHKYPPGPGSPRANSQYHRPRGSRSSSLRSFSGAPHTGGDLARASSDLPARSGHAHMFSSSSNLPRPSFGETETDGFTGLSPPPSRRTPAEEIGRALG